MGQGTNMFHSMLAVLVVFCCTIGFGLGSNHAHIGALAIYVCAALAALQLSYFVGALVVPAG